ncbi:tyrosine-type recombinase/integrase [Sulfurimonas sp. HSL3-7]|uniref:tyrosine-type recombinase/integrase n=1 Tax=Sulfonitrofixus jiaomeiensis TaxID=3131938 RepID=UPI0031F80EC0
MKQSLDHYRKAFLIYLDKFRGYSDLTLKSYDESLKEAFSFLEVEEQGSHTTFNLMPYRLHIAHLKAKTISKKVSAMRSFCSYLNDQGEKVSLKADESIKVPASLPKPINDTHIQEALSQAPLNEKLVVILLYTLGLRISELVSLELKEISSKWVRVTGKGQKSRDIPLLSSTHALMQAYIDEMRPRRFLFESEQGQLSENSLRYLVTKCFKRIGLKVTPHQLRHSYATALLNNNARIADVSELLGHASMATTQIYTKLGSSLKMQNYLKAHPLCQDDDENS